MSARRKKRRFKSGVASKKRSRLIKYLILLVIPLVIFFYIFINSNLWDGESKLPLAIATNNGDVKIVVFDPVLGEITTVIIPADTQIEVARNLGTLRIKNVNQLGENEGLSGKLLAETLTSYFRLPVTAWSDSEAEGLLTTNIFSLLKFIYTPYKTNLGIGDRVRLVFFSAGVQNTKRAVYNLSETSYLTKTTLKDGQPGYTASGRLPSSILVYFSDPEFSKTSLTLAIIDSTSNRTSARKVGEVIEVLGAKVAAIIEKDPKRFDCGVGGSNLIVVDKISTLFGCKLTEDLSTGDFDIQIEIGDEFAERF